MSMTRDPRIDPEPGDIVVATVGGVVVRRKVLAALSVTEDVRFMDSRFMFGRFGSLLSWRKWCKKNKAEVETVR